ncbi:Gfo/Idh/MocA family oxidoreductase [Saccharopolyspora sp. WRP15-2]|uniref:Gfo/Idh/MocA family oxidoreductase n=1 Tax=Saccharopolyspora oryzae TaxID=2997343 RepID=A0ABT4VAR4_9PSEU|nr:Gfo/Idh/MocA family oxidoreductase [Saccharopolyspora oryzae]MDA3630392.1 Gfo/Idh/MocA family oxidoreductase [Saccharopolyspora oryzae]
MDRIKVGIIGASPDRGWAARAHVPALRALDQCELTAVATSRPESAERAAAEFGAAHAFADARQLADHPDVDLVVVTVRVPKHRELVQAALDAGKHVYCEWPLARTAEEAEVLVEGARSAGVHNVIGLQALRAPAIVRAKELIDQGALGRITSAAVHSARGKGAAGRVPEWAAYTLQSANAAGLLEVHGGHVLSVLDHLLGGITELSADLALQHPHQVVAETGQEAPVDSPDHLVLNARSGSGATLSANVRDAEAADPRVRLEVVGTEGSLAITSTGAEDPRGTQIQMSDLELRRPAEPGLPWETVQLPQALPVTQEARNVAAVYAEIAEGLRTGVQTAPDFTRALRLHRVLDAIRTSARTGARQRLS